MSFNKFERWEEKKEEEELIKNLKANFEKVKDKIEEIPPEKKRRLFETVERASENLHRLTLIGGTALQIWCEVKGVKIPKEYKEDIDYEIEEKEFNRVRAVFPIKKEEEFLPLPPKEEIEKLRFYYRRKGKEKTPFGKFDFLKDPENYIALEDKVSYYHIDLFKKREEKDTETINFQGKKISLLTPEELFLARYFQLRESKKFQRRHIIYFYLNAGLINPEKMDELIIKKLQKKGEIINKKQAREIWGGAYKELNEKIQEAERKGEIEEEVRD